MKLETGQTVVCIDDKRTAIIKEGQLYTIAKFYTCRCGYETVGLKGISLGGWDGSMCPVCFAKKDEPLFRASRFKPLDEMVQINEVHDILKTPIPA